MKNPASRLASLRRRVTHKCAECGVEFEAIKIARYCQTDEDGNPSNACRQRAKYKRSKLSE